MIGEKMVRKYCSYVKRNAMNNAIINFDFGEKKYLPGSILSLFI